MVRDPLDDAIRYHDFVAHEDIAIRADLSSQVLTDQYERCGPDLLPKQRSYCPVGARISSQLAKPDVQGQFITSIARLSARGAISSASLFSRSHPHSQL